MVESTIFKKSNNSALNDSKWSDFAKLLNHFPRTITLYKVVESTIFQKGNNSALNDSKWSDFA